MAPHMPMQCGALEMPMSRATRKEGSNSGELSVVGVGMLASLDVSVLVLVNVLVLVLVNVLVPVLVLVLVPEGVYNRCIGRLH